MIFESEITMVEVHLPLSVSLDSAFVCFPCICVFFCGSRVLFTRPANTEKCKSNFKTVFHGTIHTFKNYYAIVFSVFNFQP